MLLPAAALFPILLASLVPGIEPPAASGGSGSSFRKLLFRESGGGAGDNFGVSAAAAGDVNHDGIPDFVVGAWFDDEAGSAAGSVSVYSGADGSRIRHFLLGAIGDRFGFVVDGVGDVDGDGHDDLVVGAPEADPRGFQSGIVYVLSGRDGAVLFRIEGDEAEQELGTAVAGIGDADGDGIGDFVVSGDESDAFDAGPGFARLYSGATGRVLREFVGTSLNSSFGEALAAAGDVNKDGHADWIVGSSGDDTNGPNTGSITVYSGADGSVLHHLQGMDFFGYFGASVAGAGDMNFDKHAEFAVGSLLDHGLRGAVRVFDGVTGKLLHEVIGDVPDLFGRHYSLANAGDLDLDGRDDFLVGDTCDLQLICGRAGHVRAYSGLDGRLLGALEGLPDDQFGFALDSLGDLDGDGIPDLLVGAFRDDLAGQDAGAVFVFSGSLPARRPNPSGTPAPRR